MNSAMPNLSEFLPTTQREMQMRGWDELDVILMSGDAYVDHPSFGVAVIGRVLEAQGLRVGIVPQPDWHGDLRDFRRLGRPRLFFGISPGCMDSMVNKYTAARRLRSEDAYSPDGRHDMRPEMPTIVYTKALKQLYPNVPVVLGGIEASLRRLSHYDYWKDSLQPSILASSGADLLIYGMGEKPMTELAECLQSQDCVIDCSLFHALMLRQPIRQTAMFLTRKEFHARSTDILLHSHEECLHDKRAQAENFRHIEEESNRWQAQRLAQPMGKDGVVVVEPPFPPLRTEELDAVYDLPFTRLPHPKYKGKRIPAYEMIRHSVTLHRGCFGGCAFCTISAHQGKFIASRSKASILREVKRVTQMPDFKGYISDLGGPSANMYGMHGRDLSRCKRCARPSCIHPKICSNLQTDHGPLLDIYHAVDALPSVKKSFIGSGVRYDLLLHNTGDTAVNRRNQQYTRELITLHVSGRLKVAPEHTSNRVLWIMRKPSFQLFYEFKHLFDRICREESLRFQLIPYFISSHPGCEEVDMAELAALTKDLNFRLEQVQDFTPTPMTVSTEIFYTGLHPYTLRPVFCTHSQKEKQQQRQFFFWYEPQARQQIIRELHRIDRDDLAQKLFGRRTT